MAGGDKKRRRWPVVMAIVVIAVLVPVAIVALPIVTHDNKGVSVQQPAAEQWPLAVSAIGDDGRTRSFTVVASTPGGVVDTSVLTSGERIVVSGTGYDASQGIYVAICKIPDDAATKPGPCLGGVPDTAEQTEVESGTIQYAPSNWINDAFAWKLFGSRSYDDEQTGTFTAYLEVGDPVAEGLDCRVDACGIYTRNDHTALRDRVQDLYVPVGFAAPAD